MTIAFDTLTVKPAPAPESKGLPLTDAVRTFATQIADAEHGLIVENVDKVAISAIKRTLAAHRETLFGTFTPRYRVVNDGKDLRITLTAPEVDTPADTPAGTPAA